MCKHVARPGERSYRKETQAKEISVQQNTVKAICRLISSRLKILWPYPLVAKRYEIKPWDPSD